MSLTPKKRNPNISPNTYEIMHDTPNYVNKIVTQNNINCFYTSDNLQNPKQNSGNITTQPPPLYNYTSKISTNDLQTNAQAILQKLSGSLGINNNASFVCQTSGSAPKPCNLSPNAKPCSPSSVNCIPTTCGKLSHGVSETSCSQCLSNKNFYPCKFKNKITETYDNLNYCKVGQGSNVTSGPGLTTYSGSCSGSIVSPKSQCSPNMSPSKCVVTSCGKQMGYNNASGCNLIGPEGSYNYIPFTNNGISYLNYCERVKE